MRLLFFVLFLIHGSLFSQTADILLKNGKILDGTGNSWYYADIAIIQGKIAKIGALSNWTAPKIIDAKGLVIAPGFIDVHTHIEGDEVKNPTADNFIYDGVTSVITGNCGLSQTNIGQYLRMIDSLKPSVNVAALIGHNDIRKMAMGSANRQASELEMQVMENLVAKAMKEGAVGLSTGLIYIPGTYANTEEVIQLAKIAAKYQGVYATHMRDEGDSVTQAIEEAFNIGRAAQIPVEISHFKLSGQQNWRRSLITIPMIEAARREGLEVTIDQYPYTASSTSLSTLMPDWVLADGQDSIKARLKRPEIRKEVIAHLLKKIKKRGLKHFSYPVVASFKPDTSYQGKSIETINQLRGNKPKLKDEAETIIQMMEMGGAGMVFHGMGEEDVKNIMRYPFNMFASDASIRVFGAGNPHPRGYGTNARVLGKYVREEKVISLEEAIRRMTSLPAKKFGLPNRGLLIPGFAADIVVFDPAKVADLSTYDQPHQYSTGFQYVIVNGQITISEGKHLGTRAGGSLRNQSSTNTHE